MSLPTPIPTTIPNTDNSMTTSARAQKPRAALALASAFGLGYLPKAPGTWGSLAGAALALLITRLPLVSPDARWTVVVLVGALGVLVAGRAARHAGRKDPQFVVIDEVSGQLLVYFSPLTVLNWQSWLLGFILFRVFDIWKPFPARQAESLPGGWGIMADDWIAGIYAAIVLWMATALMS